MPQGLQYWAEKLNSPENPDFCHLVRSVIELREKVEEYMSCSLTGDIFQGLGRVNLGGYMSQWPRTSSSSLSRMEPPLDDQSGEQDTHFMEASYLNCLPGHV